MKDAFAKIMKDVKAPEARPRKVLRASARSSARLPRSRALSCPAGRALARESPFQETGRRQNAGVVAARPTQLDADRQPVRRPKAGTVTAGVPSSVHTPLKIGSPVRPSPAGAGPGAAGTTRRRGRQRGVEGLGETPRVRRAPPRRRRASPPRPRSIVSRIGSDRLSARAGRRTRVPRHLHRIDEVAHAGAPANPSGSRIGRRPQAGPSRATRADIIARVSARARSANGSSGTAIRGAPAAAVVGAPPFREHRREQRGRRRPNARTAPMVSSCATAAARRRCRWRRPSA